MLKRNLLTILLGATLVFTSIPMNALAKEEPVITENEDGSKTIEYSEVVSEVAEDDKDSVVEEKTQEQEEIKSDIEAENGTYNYDIGVEQITLTKEEHEEEVESAEDAEALAEEVDGEVIVSETVTEGSVEKVVDTEEEVEAFVEETESNVEDEQASREITNVTTEEVAEITAEQVDDKGYHVEENEDGSFTIVITGGLEEITIDFAWFSEQQLMMPGDTVDAKFTIVNESGDKYEVTNYEKVSEGPYHYVLASKYQEEYGEQVDTIQIRGNDYVVYIPNELLTINGRLIDKTTLEVAFEMYPDFRERREKAKDLTEEDLLAFYNEKLGNNYESSYEAWRTNLYKRIWQTTYTKDGEEAQYGDEFWKSVDLTTDKPVEFTMTSTLDGIGTDNTYQNSVWGYIENITIKILTGIKVKIDYEDIIKNYSVKYTTETNGYNITITGKGEIAAPADPDIPKEPEPMPTPEPTPQLPEGGVINHDPDPEPIPEVEKISETSTVVVEEIPETPTPTSNITLTSPQTGDSDIPVLWAIIFVAGVILIIIGVDGIFKDKKK